MFLSAIRQTITADGENRVFLTANSAQSIEHAHLWKLTILPHVDRLIQDHQTYIVGVWEPSEVGETIVDSGNDSGKIFIYVFM